MTNQNGLDQFEIKSVFDLITKANNLQFAEIKKEIDSQNSRRFGKSYSEEELIYVRQKEQKRQLSKRKPKRNIWIEEW